MKEHISRELAQRLWDKGFRAGHGRIWVLSTNHTRGDDWGIIKNEEDRKLKCFDAHIPAYTFTELWGVLPDELRLDGNEMNILVMGKDKADTCLYYRGAAGHSGQAHESPAEAAGLLVEWLIDNGYEVKG
jgi:hypothetical protein